MSDDAQTASYLEGQTYDLQAGADPEVALDPGYQTVRPSDEMVDDMGDRVESHQQAMDYDLEVGVDPNVVYDPDYQSVAPEY